MIMTPFSAHMSNCGKPLHIWTTPLASEFFSIIDNYRACIESLYWVVMTMYFYEWQESVYQTENLVVKIHSVYQSLYERRMYEILLSWNCMHNPASWAFNSLYNREMVLFNVKENTILWNICRQVWDRVKKGVQSILYGPLIKMIDDSKRSTYLNQVQVISMETDKHTALH